MRFAEVSTGVVSRVTVSVDKANGVKWLQDNIGGKWVEVAKDVQCGIGYTYDATNDVKFMPPKPDGDFVWDGEAWVEVVEPSA